MTELAALVFALAVGGALGTLFFGGLWWTVLRGLTSPTPALWFFGSLLVRTGVTVIGFIMVARGHWDRMLACLLGFFVARVVVTRLTRRPAQEHSRLAQGADHAP